MNDFRARWQSGLRAGVKVGWRSFVWMCKIVVPLSLLIALLHWTGWLSRAYFILNPLMSLLHLPPEAALPILSGMLINIYAVIAALTVIPFTTGQMTLIAIFTLMAHNLIMEGIIQHQSGISFIKITLIRIVMATLTVLIVSPFLGDTSQSIAAAAGLAAQAPLPDALKSWALDTGVLLLKIFGLIMFIMILLESLKSLGWIEYLLNFFRPAMRVMGLSGRTAMMWVAAVIFGLLYGGAVIIAEAKKGELTRDELEPLHIFIGLNHSMVEDAALLALLGINIFWLWVPRFIVTVISVQLYGALKRLRKRVSG